MLSRRRRGPAVPAPPTKVREAMMDRIVVAVAIGMGLVFGTGMMVGIVAMIALAVRREDRLIVGGSTPRGSRFVSRRF